MLTHKARLHTRRTTTTTTTIIIIKQNDDAREGVYFIRLSQLLGRNVLKLFMECGVILPTFNLRSFVRAAVVNDKNVGTMTTTTTKICRQPDTR